MRHVMYLSCSVLLSAFLLTGCGGGGSGASSDESDSADTPVNPTGTIAGIEGALETRLITAVSADEVAGWACVAEDGVPFVYTFFDHSTVEGFDNAYLGIRYEPLKAGGDPWQYRWTPTDGQTVVLDSPDGRQAILTNIEFQNPGDYLKTTTEDHGLLYCQRQSGARS